MTTGDIADALNALAEHLIADGRSREAKSYSTAAETIRQRDHIPADPSNIDGVGDSIRGVISEYTHRERIERLEDLREKHPYLEELTQVDGVGPKTASRIYDELGIESVDALVERSDELTEVHRVGNKTAENIEKSAKRELNRCKSVNGDGE